MGWVIEKTIIRNILLCAFRVVSDTISRCVESFGQDGVDVDALTRHEIRTASVLRLQ